jgi:hypothetical protein
MLSYLIYLFHFENKKQTMIQLGVTEMPPVYILRRWTWNAEENLVEEPAG